MKKTILLTLLIAVSLCLTGCTTGKANGRIAIVNWDSRDPDQLQAAQYTDGVVYGTQSMQEKGEARGFSAWTELFELIKNLKIKLQVLSIEWSYNSTSDCDATKSVDKKPIKPAVTK